MLMVKGLIVTIPYEGGIKLIESSDPAWEIERQTDSYATSIL